MNSKSPEYLYHVYKITDQNDDRTEFVAEGPATRRSGYDPVEPLITYDADHLPRAIIREHLYYLQDQGFDHIVKSEDLYMSFSFNPTCHQVFRGGSVYASHALSKTEQDRFSNTLKDVYNSLDDVVDFKQQGNPLG